MGSFKYNSNGASKRNHGPRSGAFCVKNNSGNMIYVESGRLGGKINLMAEVLALRLELKYCITHNYPPLCIETDWLSIKKILDNI